MYIFEYDCFLFLAPCVAMLTAYVIFNPCSLVISQCPEAFVDESKEMKSVTSCAVTVAEMKVFILLP